MISKSDLSELRRLATNAYDDDKRFVARVINEISNMNNMINQLRRENAELQDKLNESKS